MTTERARNSGIRAGEYRRAPRRQQAKSCWQARSPVALLFHQDVGKLSRTNCTTRQETINRLLAPGHLWNWYSSVAGALPAAVRGKILRPLKRNFQNALTPATFCSFHFNPLSTMIRFGDWKRRFGPPCFSKAFCTAGFLTSASAYSVLKERFAKWSAK